MTDLVKVLFVMASPARLPHLRVDKDYREANAAIQRALERTRFELIPLLAVRANDLQEEVRRVQPQIIHFSGHGSEEGIMLEDDAGRALPIRGEALAALFRIASPAIRVVVLSACDTRPTAVGFSAFVDYTVAMRQPITDRAAVVFNTAFYGALADGTTIPVAFDYGVAALQFEHFEEKDVPELLRRPGASDVLLRVRPEPSREQHPSGITQRVNGSTVHGDVTAIQGNGNKVG